MVFPWFSLVFPGSSKKFPDPERNLSLSYHTAEPYGGFGGPVPGSFPGVSRGYPGLPGTTRTTPGDHQNPYLIFPGIFPGDLPSPLEFGEAPGGGPKKGLPVE